MRSVCSLPTWGLPRACWAAWGTSRNRSGPGGTPLPAPPPSPQAAGLPALRPLRGPGRPRKPLPSAPGSHPSGLSSVQHSHGILEDLYPTGCPLLATLGHQRRHSVPAQGPPRAARACPPSDRPPARVVGRREGARVWGQAASGPKPACDTRTPRWCPCVRVPPWAAPTQARPLPSQRGGGAGEP